MSDLKGPAYSGCEVCTVLETEANHPSIVLYRGRDWLASLRAQDQTLLGTTFITLRRHAYELDQLTTPEFQELLVVQNGLIRAIRAAFSPVTFNMSCLKNDAFKEDPDNTRPEAAHVHWHLKPRYGTQAVLFAHDTFEDPMPGRYLDGRHERHAPSTDTAVAIADRIRSKLNFG